MEIEERVRVKRDAFDLCPAVRDAVPLSVPVVFFGVVFGVLARRAGLSIAETTGMSLVVFAGVSQFAAVTMLGAGASVTQIVLATFMINSRHLFMGASIAPYFRGSGLALLLSAAGLLTDESYALSINRFARNHVKAGYYFSCSVVFYLVWVGSTLAGAAWVGKSLDVTRWGLDFAFLAAFIGILGSQVRSRAGVAALVAAASVGVAARVLLAGQWYIAAGVLGGSITGWWVENRAL